MANVARVASANAVSLRHRALSLRHRALSLRHRAVSLRRRALSLRRRALSLRRRALSLRRRALSLRHRAVSLRHRAVSLRHRAVSLRHRALSLRHRAVSLRHRARAGRRGPSPASVRGFYHPGMAAARDWLALPGLCGESGQSGRAAGRSLIAHEAGAPPQLPLAAPVEAPVICGVNVIESISARARELIQRREATFDSFWRKQLEMSQEEYCGH